jgi:hypothetical protein
MASSNFFFMLSPIRICSFMVSASADRQRIRLTPVVNITLADDGVPSERFELIVLAVD